jgi:hypothetical protein
MNSVLPLKSHEIAIKKFKFQSIKTICAYDFSEDKLTGQLLGAVFPFPPPFISRALLGNTILGQKSDFISVHQNDLRPLKCQKKQTNQLLGAVFPFPAPFIRHPKKDKKQLLKFSLNLPGAGKQDGYVLKEWRKYGIRASKINFIFKREGREGRGEL